MSGWRRKVSLLRVSGTIDSSKMISVRVGSDAMLDQILGAAMLSDNASEELASPLHDMIARLQTGMIRSSKVLSKDVTAALPVVTDGFGNRNGKTSERSLSRWRHLAAVQSSREDESQDNPPLRFVVPGLALEEIALPGSLGKALIERRAPHHAPKVHLAPQISSSGDTWHKGLDVGPKMGSEESS